MLLPRLFYPRLHVQDMAVEFCSIQMNDQLAGAKYI